VTRRDDNPAEQPNRDRTTWAKAFEKCMDDMTGNYRQVFTPGAHRMLMLVCEGWSVDKMREVFKRAILAEKFPPNAATLKNYGASVHDENDHLEVEMERPKYTAEQYAEIQQMKRDLSAAFAAMPWSRPL
jgi:hypothetical protein